MKSKYAMDPVIAQRMPYESAKVMANKVITVKTAKPQARQPLQPLMIKMPVSKSKHMQQHVAGAQGHAKLGGGPDGANIPAD